MSAIIEAASQVLSHTPQLVLSGSKVRREIARDSSLRDRIVESLRSFEDAAGYFPNRVFIGAEEPRSLADPGEAWWKRPGPPTYRGSTGVFVSEADFLQALARADVSSLLSLDPAVLETHLPLSGLVDRLVGGSEPLDSRSGELIPGADAPLGRIGWGYPDDEALGPVNVFGESCHQGVGVAGPGAPARRE